MHYVADDLGYDRNYVYTLADATPPNEDWLSDADIDIASGFLRRLKAEFRMDDFE